MLLFQLELSPPDIFHSLSQLTEMFSVNKDMKQKPEYLKQHIKPAVSAAQELMWHSLEVAERRCLMCPAQPVAPISTLHHSFINSHEDRLKRKEK